MTCCNSIKFMLLTKVEEKALSGQYGTPTMLAHKILLSIGEATDASKLVPVKWAHLSGANFNTIGDAGLDFLKSICNETKFSIFTTINPMGYDRNKPEFVSDEFRIKQKDITDAYEQMGVVPSYSCTPYEIFDMPPKNTMVSFAESNAAVISNSIFGLLTNKESALSALASAITGKAPYSELRVEEFRHPKERIMMADCDLSNELEYGMLGYFAGKEVKGSSVAIDCTRHLDLINAKSLSASIGTSGYCGMFTNQSPEGQVETITYDKAERVKVFDELSTAEDGDIIALGSPQLGLDELNKVALSVDNKKFTKPCMIFCARSIYEKATMTQISQKIEKAGAKIICDACTCLTPLITRDCYDGVITNSVKASYYLNKSNKIPVCLMDINNILKNYVS
jgi:predicted aconitase